MINIYAVSYMTATRTNIDALRRLCETRQDKRASERQRIWAPRGSWWRRSQAEKPKDNR